MRDDELLRDLARTLMRTQIAAILTGSAEQRKPTEVLCALMRMQIVVTSKRNDLRAHILKIILLSII